MRCYGLCGVVVVLVVVVVISVVNSSQSDKRMILSVTNAEMTWNKVDMTRSEVVSDGIDVTVCNKPLIKS